MTHTLPLFPLKLVAFPGEKLALHIFEERYRQLVSDCENEKITFGIPTYLDGVLKYGTEMTLVNVVKRYPEGSCDIICQGGRIFELLSFQSSLEGKLYAGGDVRFLKNDTQIPEKKKKELLRLIVTFYDALEVQPPKYSKKDFTSYTLAHKAGLTIEQEYELLQITSEDKRMDYLISHLSIMTSTLSAVSRTKELIALNGHFKHFDPLDFNNLEI